MGRPRKLKDSRSRFGNVEPLPSGKWRARYKHKGVAQSRTFVIAADGWDWLNEIQDKIRRQEMHSIRDGKRPFSEVAEEYMAELVTVTPGTVVDYRYILDADLLPYFGDDPIAEIDVRDVRRWAKDFGHSRSPGTVKKHKNTLSAIFNFAIEMRYRNGNPCSLVRVASGERDEMVFLNQAEVLRLAAALPGDFGLAVRLAAYSGLRMGEMWDLKVKSLQPSKGRVLVVSNVREVKGIGLVSRPVPKNGQWRSALVPEKLMYEVVKHVADEGRSGDDYVFNTALGYQVRHNRFRSRVWNPVVDKLHEAGDISVNPRPHDLRHTCAAFYFGRGATGEEVRRVLGHSSITTTHKHYAHIFPEAFDRMVQGLDADIAAAEAEFEATSKLVRIK